MRRMLTNGNKKVARLFISFIIPEILMPAFQPKVKCVQQRALIYPDFRGLSDIACRGKCP